MLSRWKGADAMGTELKGEECRSLGINVIPRMTLAKVSSGLAGLLNNE